jgi:peroxiredoxin Q/BCP
MKAGDYATDFELFDQNKAARRLSSVLAGGPVVLFFYPAALSRGCTAEACHFRDLHAELSELGAQCVGISADSPDKQSRFAVKHELGFLLLSDTDRAVARQFGVTGGLPFGRVRRSTFVIDTDLRVIGVISTELQMNVHADRALDVLRSRPAGKEETTS